MTETRGRPATTADQIITLLEEADGAWVGFSELFEAIPVTYSAFRSSLHRLTRQHRIERMEEKWRGNQHEAVREETAWYRRTSQ